MQTLKGCLGVIGAGVAAIVALTLLVALIFGATWGDIEFRRFFGPRRAEVEREVFLQTRSYREGMLQQLARYRLEYQRADESDKEAIAGTVRTMFAQFDPADVSNPELRAFLLEVNR